MANFLSCIATIIFLLGMFSSLGIGLVLLLQPSAPSRSLQYPLLLCPIIGYVLLASIGVTKLAFSMPLSPLMSTMTLLAVSLTLCWLRHKQLPECLTAEALRGYFRLGVPAVVFAIYFSFLFHPSGLELLSGSQDEYQYCSDATHMLLHQNKGGADDTPIPRVDHWLYDYQTRLICYTTKERRDTLLASTMSLTSLTAPQCFPALVGAVLTALILGIGAISKDCLRLDASRTAVLQLGFAGLFYLTVIHIQGSLGIILSLPCYLIGAVLLGVALNRSCHWGLTALTGVIIGGGVLIYPDGFAFEIAAALTVVLLESLIHSTKDYRRCIFGKFVLLGLVALFIASQSALIVIPKILYNVTSIRANHLISPKEPSISSLLQAPLALNLGVISNYDNSPVHNAMDEHLASHFDRLIAIATIFYAVALCGYLGLGRRCRGLQVPFFLLVLMLGAFLFSHDSLRVARVVCYSIPYLFIGLVLATRAPSRFRFVPAVGIVTLIIFLAMNVLTQVATAKYITQHTLRTDKLVKRLNPVHPDWCSLRDELKKFPKTPVLLSGFEDTPNPHRIVSAIEPQPNFLGESITHFWKILVPCGPWLEVLESEKALVCKDLKRPIARWDWAVDYPRMVRDSQQAIVPPGADFPSEWKQWADVLPAYRTRYSNICDVVYKDKKALLEDPAVAEFARDEQGGYRYLLKVWKPRLSEDGFALYILTVAFDGAKSDLLLRGLMNRPRIAEETDGRSKLEVAVSSLDFGKFALEPQKAPLRLRSIELRELRTESDQEVINQFNKRCAAANELSSKQTAVVGQKCHHEVLSSKMSRLFF